MKQKNIFIIGGIIIVLIIIGIYSQSLKENGESLISEQEASESKTAFSVPEGTVVPQQGEKGMSEEQIDNITHNNIVKAFNISIKNEKKEPDYNLKNEYDFNAFSN